MAIETSPVTADVVKVREWPHLARAYAVSGVPMTEIGDRVCFTGAEPVSTLLQLVLEAVDAEDTDER